LVSSLRPANTLTHPEEFISVKDVLGDGPSRGSGVSGDQGRWLGARAIICCQAVATSRNLGAAKKTEAQFINEIVSLPFPPHAEKYVGLGKC